MNFLEYLKKGKNATELSEKDFISNIENLTNFESYVGGISFCKEVLSLLKGSEITISYYNIICSNKAGYYLIYIPIGDIEYGINIEFDYSHNSIFGSARKEDFYSISFLKNRKVVPISDVPDILLFLRADICEMRFGDFV